MGANNFIAFAPIPVGTAVGPQAAVDLWTLVPSTGLNKDFTVICSGEFIGTISIEGSLNGVDYSPVGGFSLGQRANEQIQDGQFDLAPINVLNVVRYLRVRVGLGTVIRTPVYVTIGGGQNCDCAGGAGLTDEIAGAIVYWPVAGTPSFLMQYGATLTLQDVAPGRTNVILPVADGIARAECLVDLTSLESATFAHVQFDTFSSTDTDKLVRAFDAAGAPKDDVAFQIRIYRVSS